jgi:hypothetical protein
MITLFKENAHYRVLIEQARRTTVFLRKPGARAEIEGVCPGHCATHRISGYPLMRFLCKVSEQTTDLFAGEALELSPQINLLTPLLEKIFERWTIFLKLPIIHAKTNVVAAFERPKMTLSL